LCVFIVATYGCEAWTRKKADINRITAFKHKCYQKILCVPWVQQRTKKEISEELDVLQDWLISTVRCQKFTFFGHMKRHNRIERQISEEFISGKRRGGGQPQQKWTKCITDAFRSLKTAGQLAQECDCFRAVVWAAS